MAILERHGHQQTTNSGSTAERIRRKICWLALLAVICVATTGVQDCCAKAPSEFQVKAAFLYNFAKFVEWPSQSFADANSPIAIGVLGENQFADAIEQISKGKTIGGRRLVVRRLNADSDLESCHILFVSAAEKRNVPRILGKVKDACVLTVGESDGFIASGGVIGLVVQDSKVAFDINAGAAKKRQLKISSQLLKLARNVKD